MKSDGLRNQVKRVTRRNEDDKGWKRVVYSWKRITRGGKRVEMERNGLRNHVKRIKALELGQ